MRAPRQPIFKIPPAILALLVILIVIHAIRVVLPSEIDDRVLVRFAFVPIRASSLVDHQAVLDRFALWAGSTDDSILRARDLADAFLQASAPAVLGSFVGYAFLHGDWTHLGFNAVWLLAFGAPVARRFRAGRFYALLLASAVAGAVAHWICFPFGVDPVIGASASVSGCMGAASRFVFTSTGSDPEPSRRTVRLLDVLRDRRTLSFVLVWFFSNALFGVGALSFGLTQAPVAWQAHMGGFLVGLLAFRAFDPRARRSPGADRDSAVPS